jgi:hypothetical protein
LAAGFLEAVFFAAGFFAGAAFLTGAFFAAGFTAALAFGAAALVTPAAVLAARAA